MTKNVSGQKVGCQMVAVADGSAFTSAVTVAVTIDAGTQATGTVGSGACTHEGNGYHTYAPSQAETNGDLVAFTFTGSGAMPETVQIYTRDGLTTQQKADVNAEADTAISDYGPLKPTTAGRTLDVSSTGEAGLDWANIGAPTTTVDLSGTTISAVNDAPEVTDMAAAVWDEAQSGHTTAGTFGKYLDAAISSVSGGGATAADIADAVWDEATSGHTTAGSYGKLAADNLDATVSSRATQTSVDAVDNFVDTEVAAILAAVDTEVAAIKAKTDSLTFTTAGQVDANIQSINDAALTGDGSSGTPWGPA